MRRNYVIAKPEIPEPTYYGCKLEDPVYTQITTKLPPASEAVTKLIRCNCIVLTCRRNCTCSRNNHPCTEMCKCGAIKDHCKNVAASQYILESGSDNDV